MDIIEKKEVEKLKKNFYHTKKTKDEGLFLQDLTAIIGLYRINKEEETYKLIEEMINFGKKQKWAMQAAMIQLNKIKQ